MYQQTDMTDEANRLLAQSISEGLRKPFHTRFIKLKEGRKYLDHADVRNRIIQVTGGVFTWEVDQVLFRDADDGVVKARGSGHAPKTMIVIGRLTIPPIGVQTGIGVSALEQNAGEDTYKSADSDAFKRAAMGFGIGLEQLYDTLSPVLRTTPDGTPDAVQTTTAPEAAREVAVSSAKEPESDEVPATEQQLNAIKALLIKNGWKAEQFGWDDFRAGEAAEWIESLSAQGKLPQGVTDPNAMPLEVENDFAEALGLTIEDERSAKAHWVREVQTAMAGPGDGVRRLLDMIEWGQRHTGGAMTPEKAAMRLKAIIHYSTTTDQVMEVEGFMQRTRLLTNDLKSFVNSKVDTLNSVTA